MTSLIALAVVAIAAQDDNQLRSNVKPSEMIGRSIIAVAQPVGERKIYESSVKGMHGPRKVSICVDTFVIESANPSELSGTIRTLFATLADSGQAPRPKASKYLVLLQKEPLKAISVPTKEDFDGVYQAWAVLPTKQNELTPGSTIPESWYLSLLASGLTTDKVISSLSLGYVAKQFTSLMKHVGAEKIGDLRVDKWFLEKLVPVMWSRASSLPYDVRLPIFCIGSAMFDKRCSRVAFETIKAMVLNNHLFTHQDMEWLKLAYLMPIVIDSDELIDLGLQSSQVEIRDYLIQRVHVLPKTESAFRKYLGLLDEQSSRAQILQDLAQMVSDSENLYPAPRFFGEPEPEQWGRLRQFWGNMTLEQAQKYRDNRLRKGGW